MNVIEQPDPIQESDIIDEGAKAKSKTETTTHAKFTSEKPDAVSQVSAEPVPEPKRGIYGPIVRGESVTKLVKKMGYPNSEVARVSVALWMDNKDQFIGENIHGLKEGAMLQLDGIAVLKKHLNAHSARRMMDDQWQQWIGDPIEVASAGSEQVVKTERMAAQDQLEAQATLVALEKNTRQEIHKGDTLLMIAGQLGFNSKEAQSAVVAIWIQNKDKFIRGNLNGLKVGQTLDLANIDSRRKDLDPTTVNQIIESQWQEWTS
jgi:Tfp pilus assembly protein FimV